MVVRQEVNGIMRNIGMGRFKRESGEMYEGTCA